MGVRRVDRKHVGREFRGHVARLSGIARRNVPHLPQAVYMVLFPWVLLPMRREKALEMIFSRTLRDSVVVCLLITARHGESLLLVNSGHEIKFIGIAQSVNQNFLRHT